MMTPDTTETIHDWGKKKKKPQHTSQTLKAVKSTGEGPEENHHHSKQITNIPTYPEGKITRIDTRAVGRVQIEREREREEHKENKKKR